MANSSSSYTATNGQSANSSWCWAPDFLILGRPPWWKDGIVIYSYNSLSFSGPSPAELIHTLLSRSRGSRFNSRWYQIFWEIVGLELDAFSLVSTTEELLGRNSSGYSLEGREYGRRNLLCWPHDTLYLQKLALSSLTSDGRLVSVVHSWTKGTKFNIYLYIYRSTW
jgi:hypothetical protein